MRRMFVGLISLALALALASCGGSNEGTPQTSANGGENGSSTSEGITEALRVGILYEVQGESSVATSDFANAAKLAIEEINGSGGVGGKPIEYNRMPVSALDPQQAVSDFLAMVDWGPDLILGFPSGVIEAVAPQITRSQIPVLTIVQEEEIGYGNKFGSEYLWMMQPVGSEVPSHATDFFVNELGKTDLAVLGVDATFGRGSSEQTEDKLVKLNLKPQSQQLIPVTATDLTAQVLEMKGADAVTAWIYPNQVGLLAKQLQQNGITVPIIAQSSMELAVKYGTMKPSTYPAGLYATLPCAITGAEPGSKLSEFTDNYKEAYDAAPFSAAVTVYDGVHLAAAAAEAAKSTAPQALNDALSEVTYDGACVTYDADPAHFLAHRLVIAQYNDDGTSEIIKEYSLPEREKGQS